MNLAALLHLYLACAVVCATTSACDGEPATVEELDFDDTTVVVFDVFDTLDCPDGFRSVAGACSVTDQRRGTSRRDRRASEST